MTAGVVNLRQARKRRQRADKERRAEENRVIHGRTKDEKKLARARNEKAVRDHEAGRVVRTGGADDSQGEADS
jgi:hypothetical protein